MSGRYWKKEEVEKLIKLREQGLLFKEIGEILGRTKGSCACRYTLAKKDGDIVEYDETIKRKKIDEHIEMHRQVRQAKKLVQYKGFEELESKGGLKPDYQEETTLRRDGRWRRI